MSTKDKTEIIKPGGLQKWVSRWAETQPILLNSDMPHLDLDDWDALRTWWIHMLFSISPTYFDEFLTSNIIKTTNYFAMIFSASI